MSEVLEINQDTLEKALKHLGIDLENINAKTNNPFLEKGSKSNQLNSFTKKSKKITGEPEKKTEDKVEDKVEDKTEDKKEENMDLNLFKEDIKKSMDTLELSLQEENKNLKIQNQELLEKLDNITNLIVKSHDSMDIKFTAVGELEKATLDNLNTISKRLDFLENKPDPRKSITTKNDIVEKGFDTTGISTNRLSATRNKKEIISLLENKAGMESETPNKQYVEALLQFESSGFLEKSIITDLYQKDKILIVE